MSVGDAEEGSIITLRTTQVVDADETLTISYVPLARSVDERRGLLSFQHGFVCECRRCVVESAVGRLAREEEDGDESNQT